MSNSDATLVVVSTNDLTQLIEAATTRAVSAALSQFTLPTTAKPSEALTFNQVRLRLNLSSPTLRKLLVSGTLHGVRAGKRWLIPSGEMERFLSEGASHEPL
jgi:excisionase family DNA binding protein